MFNKSQWADGHTGTFTHPPTQVTPRHKIIRKKKNTSYLVALMTQCLDELSGKCHLQSNVLVANTCYSRVFNLLSS